MATAIGNPHDPSVMAVNEGRFDLAIHISNLGDGGAEPRVRQMCDRVAVMFPHLRSVIAYPLAQHTMAPETVASASGDCRAVAYHSELPAPGIPPVRSMQECRNAFTFSQSVDAKACVLLGAAGDLLSTETLGALVDSIFGNGVDLTLSAYQTSPFDGMVNSAILYPLSRVISGSAVRYPLAPDFAVSAGAQASLLQQSLRNTDQGQVRILWPSLELELSGFKVAQVAVGPRAQPPASSLTLTDLITEVVGSLFSTIEVKASLWQRTLLRKQSVLSSNAEVAIVETGGPDPTPLVESFKLGSSNLQEIWRLVLPPQTLLALKRLAQLSTDEFQMPDGLWVKIVYDFLLAHKSRTLSRKHLLGALTPLYLGWVASYVMDIARIGHDKMEERIDMLATAFEVDRPYLVSQWRWPDRFNP